MEFSDVLTIVGMLVTGATTLWGVTKYLIERMDGIADDCHKRISAMTKQSDFDKHMEHTDRQFTEIRQDIKDSRDSFASALDRLGSNLTTRLDSIMLLLGKNKE